MGARVTDSNRRVRTRTHGGVAGVGGQPPPLCRSVYGDSALAFTLSGPAQASLALRPVRSLTHPVGGPVSLGLRWLGRPHHLPGSYQDVPTPPWAGLSPAALTDLSRHAHTAGDTRRLSAQLPGDSCKIPGEIDAEGWLSIKSTVVLKTTVLFGVWIPGVSHSRSRYLATADA